MSRRFGLETDIAVREVEKLGYRVESYRPGGHRIYSLWRGEKRIVAGLKVGELRQYCYGLTEGFRLASEEGPF